MQNIQKNSSKSRPCQSVSDSYNRPIYTPGVLVAGFVNLEDQVRLIGHNRLRTTLLSLRIYHRQSGRGPNIFSNHLSCSSPFPLFRRSLSSSTLLFHHSPATSPASAPLRCPTWSMPVPAPGGLARRTMLKRKRPPKAWPRISYTKIRDSKAQPLTTGRCSCHDCGIRAMVKRSLQKVSYKTQV
jgi:hypothetical protein